jgi:hypothetical protein
MGISIKIKDLIMNDIIIEEEIKCSNPICNKIFPKYKAVKVYLNCDNEMLVIQYLCPYCDKIILGVTDVEPYTPPKHYEPKKSKGRIKVFKTSSFKTIGIKLTSQEYKVLKEYCEKENIAMSYFFRAHVISILMSKKECLRKTEEIK